ncbi:hypothetical protein SPBR_04874 [Sporothrix brasiliensis 5110]|uniref:PWWP domain-containing protein n=1 Tax=Sporothrix brasiliensis 5110 TaxID=1398154 RepID=A0A0C2ENW8_9PEZI|nr:uncharacterized protein SPBR_04874 [Sporothrix brasiliensis 5110]KIH87829.1 hypothetical protein SPBR_04874 [Sporothrix brasiliensis 5110]
MAEAAKDDKAPTSPSAVVKDAAAPVKETGDDVKADGAKVEAAADPSETRADDGGKKEEEAEKETDAAPAGAEGGDAAATPSKTAKTPTTLARRKSVGQKLNRKGSKARIVHLDAKPGDHYFVKLKGYPAWPAVVCDEDMLPQTLIKGRPVTAARPDGTYREDYADGGKRAADRTFPVMYLYTNEFGWVPNTDMIDLDPEKALAAINDKMRKDLQKAHQLAAEHHPLSYYKDLLRQFQEELEEAEEAKRQAAEAKRLAASTPKKSKKAPKEDVDMLDVPEDDDDEQPTTASKKSKKRKAEEDTQTPQRSDSVKKPKIKITSSGTPKSNGTPSSSAKAKQTSKASAVGKSTSKEAAALAEELDPEEKRKRKAKEVLFLRHKIQKGLLTRDQAPKEDEMKTVSDYLTKLEGFPDLEVGVIRETKINKVLKAILKIATIPREDEFKFKPRSQTLLEKWNKLLAAEPAADAAPAPAAANGTATTNGNGEAKSNGVDKDVEKKEKSDKAGSEPAAESDKPKEEPAAVEATA